MRVAKRRLLIVDNEPDITFTLSSILEENGFEVVSFNHPLLALRSFKPRYYELVILDIRMPKMDGFELSKRLKKVDPDVKVCFLTASEMYHEEIRGVQHCALNKDLFLQKPISTADLIGEINKKINSTQ